MNIDSSALLGILFAEEDAPDFARAIAKARSARLISAANWLERRSGWTWAATRSRAMPSTTSRKAGVIVEAVTLKQAQVARHAYRVYGKGDGPPRRLELRRLLRLRARQDDGEPLLFKGDDLASTDIKAAIDEIFTNPARIRIAADPET